MSEIFETVKDTFSAKSGKGGKKAALLWGVAGVVVAGVALYVGSRKRTTAPESVTAGIAGYSIPYGTPTPEVSAADLEALAKSFSESQKGILSGIGAEIDRIDSSITQLGTSTSATLAGQQAAIQQQQTALTSTVSSFTNALRSVESKIEEQTITPAPAGTGTVAAAAPVQADKLASQVYAYEQIQKLKGAWSATTDPVKRAAIHAQADAIGIAAGFGSGGGDGSKRVIPSEVLQAAGGV